MGMEAYNEFEKLWQKKMVEQKDRYISATKSLLYQYPGQKYILQRANIPSELEGIPPELMEEYQKKINYARFITAWVDEAMDRIRPMDHSEVIDMLFFQRMSKEQIADKLFCNERTVQRWKDHLVNEVRLILFGLDPFEAEVV